MPLARTHYPITNIISLSQLMISDHKHNLNKINDSSASQFVETVVWCAAQLQVPVMCCLPVDIYW